MNWGIKVIFINEYDDSFDKDEQKEQEDSEYRFLLAIEKTIRETGVVPTIGDWIYPLSKPDYTLDIGKISGRNFDPKKRIITFEIE